MINRRYLKKIISTQRLNTNKATENNDGVVSSKPRLFSGLKPDQGYVLVNSIPANEDDIEKSNQEDKKHLLELNKWGVTQLVLKGGEFEYKGLYSSVTTDKNPLVHVTTYSRNKTIYLDGSPYSVDEFVDMLPTGIAGTCSGNRIEMFLLTICNLTNREDALFKQSDMLDILRKVASVKRIPFTFGFFVNTPTENNLTRIFSSVFYQVISLGGNYEQAFVDARGFINKINPERRGNARCMELPNYVNITKRIPILSIYETRKSVLSTTSGSHESKALFDRNKRFADELFSRVLEKIKSDSFSSVTSVSWVDARRGEGVIGESSTDLNIYANGVKLSQIRNDNYPDKRFQATVVDKAIPRIIDIHGKACIDRSLAEVLMDLSTYFHGINSSDRNFLNPSAKTQIHGGLVAIPTDNDVEIQLKVKAYPSSARSYTSAQLILVITDQGETGWVFLNENATKELRLRSKDGVEKRLKIVSEKDGHIQTAFMASTQTGSSEEQVKAGLDAVRNGITIIVIGMRMRKQEAIDSARRDLHGGTLFPYTVGAGVGSVEDISIASFTDSPFSTGSGGGEVVIDGPSRPTVESTLSRVESGTEGYLPSNLTIRRGSWEIIGYRIEKINMVIVGNLFYEKQNDSPMVLAEATERYARQLKDQCSVSNAVPMQTIQYSECTSEQLFDHYDDIKPSDTVIHVSARFNSNRAEIREYTGEVETSPRESNTIKEIFSLLDDGNKMSVFKFRDLNRLGADQRICACFTYTKVNSGELQIKSESVEFPVAVLEEMRFDLSADTITFEDSFIHLIRIEDGWVLLYQPLRHDDRESDHLIPVDVSRFNYLDHEEILHVRKIDSNVS